MNKTIYSIQYMRGIAALIVILFHFKVFLNGVYAQEDLGIILFNNGAMGVDLFFMLSGFIIAFSTENDSSTKNFCIKRFFRIYPVYFLILFTYVLLIPSIDFNRDVLKSMFFIHHNYSSVAPYFGYSTVYPAWTLTYEIIFYSIFIVAMKINHSSRILLSSIFIISINVWLQLAFNGAYSITGNISADYDGQLAFVIKTLSSPMMLEFIIGMMVFVFYKNIKLNPNNKTTQYLVKYTVAISVSYALIAYMSGVKRYHGIYGFGIAALMVLFAGILYEKTNKLRNLSR